MFRLAIAVVVAKFARSCEGVIFVLINRDLLRAFMPSRFDDV